MVFWDKWLHSQLKTESIILKHPFLLCRNRCIADEMNEVFELTIDNRNIDAEIKSWFHDIV